MKRFNDLIVQRSKLIILIAVLITVFLGYHAAHFRIDSSVENLYDQNDPNKRYDDEVRARFGGDDTGVIGLVADNVYVVGYQSDNSRIVAAKPCSHLVVVPFVGIVLIVEIFDRTIDAEMRGMITEENGDQNGNQND